MRLYGRSESTIGREGSRARGQVRLASTAAGNRSRSRRGPASRSRGTACRSRAGARCRPWRLTALRRFASSASSTSRSSRRSFTLRRTLSPVAHQRQRPAGRGLRRDVQHDGAVGGARHARVRDAHHVLDARRQQLLGDRQEARLRHGGGAARAGVLQDEEIVGRDVELRGRRCGRPGRRARRTPPRAPVFSNSAGVAAERLMMAPSGASEPNSATSPPCGSSGRAADLMTRRST